MIARLVATSRGFQGFPERVTDPAVLRRVAVLVLAATAQEVADAQP